MPKRKSDAGRKAEAVAAITHSNAEVDLCGRLIVSAMAHLETFYRKHPEWAGDARGVEACEWFSLWVGEATEMVREYRISYKDPP